MYRVITYGTLIVHQGANYNTIYNEWLISLSNFLKHQTPNVYTSEFPYIYDLNLQESIVRAFSYVVYNTLYLKIVTTSACPYEIKYLIHKDFPWFEIGGIKYTTFISIMNI
jgi:hypothetical protein